LSAERPIDIVGNVIGADVPRIDGLLKVTGRARYASDTPVANVAFACLRTSAIARGRIVRIDDTVACMMPGVLDVFTHMNVGEVIRPGKMSSSGGYMHGSIAPLRDDRVHYDGQIIAMVVADTFEVARDAVRCIDVHYEEEQPSATFGSAGAELRPAKPISGREKAPSIGNADAALTQSSVVIDAWYGTATQHHNPLELFSSTCAWDDEGRRLTVWEGSQNVRAMQHGLAKQLDIDADDIHIVSPFIGGAFGSRGSLGQHTAIVALAAQRLRRPVKLVVERKDCFTIATHRAETRHHVRIGASRDGTLHALVHEGWETTSRPDRYCVAGVESTTRMYRWPNARGDVFNVHVDRNTPGFMRAPPETPYMFALESAMDELAYALEMDPVELRKRNDTQRDVIKDQPFTSRHLVECLDAGAEAFGWVARDHRPGSMRDGDWLVGWGCASAIYATQIGPAAARVTMQRDGGVLVETGAHDIGNGAYTVVAQTAAELLAVPIDRVKVALGDSQLPAAPISAGSNTTASVCNAVAAACLELRDKLASASDAERLEPIVSYVEHTPKGFPPLIAMRLIKRGIPILKGGGGMKDQSRFAFGAQFVEVRVHRLTGEIRVPRIVGAYACGRIMNPRTAKSQLMGGQIWGVSSALFEATEMDRRTARYYSDDLERYLIPVNADIRAVTTIMLPERDEQVNPLGVKGVGELGTVGLNAAVANAVYHATAVRVRQLPIRLEQLLDSPMLRAAAPALRRVVRAEPVARPS
jgi:xanthine dehydrogenase YagR molybdenum-binding subunit